MGSVVQELRGALSESEKLIDQFFRNPSDPAVLMPVPGQLQAMRGVLSVLGVEQATQAVLRMRDDVDALVAAGADAGREQPLYERLAGNLSALSFLIDLLGVQPQVAKAMFRYDPASGLLESSMARPSSLLEAAAATRVESALIEEVQQLASGASGAMPLDEVARGIERLSLAPAITAQPDLVASIENARSALDEAGTAPSETQTRARIACSWPGTGISTAGSDGLRKNWSISFSDSDKAPRSSCTTLPIVCRSETRRYSSSIQGSSGSAGEPWRTASMRCARRRTRSAWPGSSKSASSSEASR